MCVTAIVCEGQLLNDTGSTSETGSQNVICRVGLSMPTGFVGPPEYPQWGRMHDSPSLARVISGLEGGVGWQPPDDRSNGPDDCVSLIVGYSVALFEGPGPSMVLLVDRRRKSETVVWGVGRSHYSIGRLSSSCQPRRICGAMWRQKNKECRWGCGREMTSNNHVDAAAEAQSSTYMYSLCR
jgi:hypothetical protein